MNKLEKALNVLGNTIEKVDDIRRRADKKIKKIEEKQGKLLLRSTKFKCWVYKIDKYFNNPTFKQFLFKIVGFINNIIKNKNNILVEKKRKIETTTRNIIKIVDNFKNIIK